MSSWVRIVIALALLMHGLGMIGGGIFLAIPKREAASTFGDSWLLVKLGRVPQSVIAVLLWCVSGVAFVAAAYGFWTNATWWTTGVWIGAPTTLLAVVLWAGAIPAGTYVGAVFAIVMMIAIVAGWVS